MTASPQPPTGPDASPAEEHTLLTAHPAFGWFWCSRVAGGMAFQICAVAVGWQVYDLTHSTFQLGMVGLAQFLPMLLLTLHAGHVADRHDRRTVTIVSLVVQGLSLGYLAVASAGHWITAPQIFVAVAIMGGARAYERPATVALMPTLVTSALLPTAMN